MNIYSKNKVIKELDIFIEILKILENYSKKCPENEAKIITNFLSQIEEIRMLPRKNLLPISKLEESATQIMKNCEKLSPKLNKSLKKLKCIFSLCRVTEAMLKTRHPNLNSPLKRSYSRNKSMLLDCKFPSLAYKNY